jgi:hypothetical protein
MEYYIPIKMDEIAIQILKICLILFYTKEKTRTVTDMGTAQDCTLSERVSVSG